MLRLIFGKFNWKKPSLLLLIAIVILAAILRLYRIREYMTFLGDEGRDMLIVKRMIIDHKLTLLGPITSVGSIYMGPIYYYFMAPFLFLSSLDPIGPSLMVVLFSLLTIILIYKTCAEFFKSSVGLLASFLYAISPLTILYGRSSWNPNIVPFFALLTVYSLLKISVKGKYNWFIVLGMTLGILFQLHYVTFMFIPIVLCVLLLNKFKYPLRFYLLFILGVLITYSPFLLFEIRHDFVNFHQALRFMSQQKTESPITVYKVFSVMENIIVRLFWRLITPSSAELAKIVIISSFYFVPRYFTHYFKDKTNAKALQVLLIWLIVGVFSFALYRGVVYDYYFGSLFPAPFILISIFITILWQMKIWGKISAFFVCLALIIMQVKHSPLWTPPSNLLKNTETISRFVFEKANNVPYNFALIAGKNSDHAYRYFLETWGNPPVTIENPQVDPERKTVTNKLLIVCEEKECKPLGHPLWEIAGFGPAEIIGEWPVVTARVFELTKFEERK